MPTPEMPLRSDPTEDLIEPERGKLIIPGLRSSPPDKALSLVVPTYNEAQNIAETVRRIWAVLYAAVGPAFEIIIVDDDSPEDLGNCCNSYARVSTGTSDAQAGREVSVHGRAPGLAGGNGQRTGCD